jgi:integrase
MSKTFHFRKDAETWARQTEAKVETGDLPPDVKILQTIILADLVKRYRATITVAKRGASVEQVVLDRFLDHPICLRRLSELRTEDFGRYRDDRLKVVSPTTLKRQFNPIRHMFEVARTDWGVPIRENPLRKLKLNAPDQRRERRLRDGEFVRLIDAAKSRRNPLIEAVIRFAIATGMRRGEILGMRWAHVDRVGRSLIIPKTKNGHSRIIPLTNEALAVLRPDGPPNDLVFPIKAAAFRMAWDRVNAKAGIDDLHFHDLRHEAISTFFENGLSTPEVALISGHKDMRMLFRYSHATRQNILRRLNRLQEVDR